MREQEFLAELRKGLSGLPQDDIEERMTFYSEMINDRIEEGLTEENAVAEIGTVQDVVSQIMSEIPLSKIVKEKVKQKRALSAWEIVLLVLGSPIWLSLLIAACVIVLSVYVAIWSVIVSLWAVEFGVAVCSLGGILSAAIWAIRNNAWQSVAMLGACLACVGISILLFFGCKQVTKGVFILTKKFLVSVKSWFIRKEEAK